MIVGVEGRHAVDEMTEALYAELRAMARHERFRSGQPATLQTTAVLHETYMKLVGSEHWRDRDHFLASACTAMRHVLIDAARARLAAKRDASREPTPEGEAKDERMDRLGAALEALARHDPELARLVDCRFFGGLTETETARVLGVSDRTVRRHWLRARAWIHGTLTTDA